MRLFLHHPPSSRSQSAFRRNLLLKQTATHVDERASMVTWPPTSLCVCVWGSAGQWSKLLPVSVLLFLPLPLFRRWQPHTCVHAFICVVAVAPSLSSSTCSLFPVVCFLCPIRLEEAVRHRTYTLGDGGVETLQTSGPASHRPGVQRD